MKLSEIIKELQKYYNENGDLEVTVTGSILTGYDDNCRGIYEYFEDEEIYDIRKLENHITLETKTINL